jgi:hypothetical protein
MALTFIWARPNASIVPTPRHCQQEADRPHPGNLTTWQALDVRFGSLADVSGRIRHVCFVL